MASGRRIEGRNVALHIVDTRVRRTLHDRGERPTRLSPDAKTSGELCFHQGGADESG